MRVKPGQVQALAQAIVRALTDRDLILPKTDPLTIQQRVADLLYQNFEEEAALEREAEEMAEQYVRGREDLDRRKLVLGIKERLARERGFVL
ncbi:MAG: DUF507 family protein [Candidatus Binatia bacterium]|nr:DUF507 family protein [Candidatus Binatia bacterium]